jgi:hypothetical protein
VTPFIRKNGRVEWRRDPDPGAEHAEIVEGREWRTVRFFQVRYRNDLKELRAFVEAGSEQSTAMSAGAELLKRGHGERLRPRIEGLP